jgi:alkanesulfonate monooxygenase SsuD/methylene tetrahydromethanopterin reductase-like flavin-dependent oxidoreductase (luciferase family)
MSGAEYKQKLHVIHAAAAEAGRPTRHFEAAMQIQVALGPDRKKMLEHFTRVKPAAAMSLLIPGAVWAKHNLKHPLGESFEGFPDIIPNEVSAAALADAERQVTPDLLNEGVCAGTVDDVIEEVKPLVAAGLKHVVLWNVGPLATGGGPADIMRQTQLVWRLKKLQTNGA